MTKVFIINRYLPGGGHVTLGRAFATEAERNHHIEKISAVHPDQTFLSDEVMIGGHDDDGQGPGIPAELTASAPQGSVRVPDEATGPLSPRDAARKAFRDAGLDYTVLTTDNVQLLKAELARALKESGLMKGSYRMRNSGRVTYHMEGWELMLRCKAFHFEDREAVSFNRGGFIGFAGWADDANIVPVLEAFGRWVEMVRPRARSAG